MAIAIEGAVRGQPWLWTAPTYDQVRIGWEETKRACGKNVRFNQDRMTAFFPNDGTILYRSLDDPDNARGHTAAGVVMDEASVVKPEAWYEVIRPVLLDTGGTAWFLFTPAGRNWVWRESMAAVEREDSAAWQVPTVGCRIVDGRLERAPHPYENPEIAFAEIEQLYRTLPERVFRQEILAEFVANEGTVFRNLDACLGAPRDPKPDQHATAKHQIVMGVDWGKHNDFTSISVGCLTCRVEVARDRFNRIDYHFQRGRLEALAERWHPRVILAESNAMGEPIIEQLQRAGLPVVGFSTTATSKPPLIENLALALERTEWQFQSDPVWTGELEAYERTVSSTTGRSSYGAPPGLHDDTVIARALMVWNGNRGQQVIEGSLDLLETWRG